MSSRDLATLINKAVETIKNDGLVIMPTETVYGLAANALSSSAVAKIFAAKQRPANNPLIVHLHSLDQLNCVVSEFPPLALKLAEKFWPGPITMVLPRKSTLPDIVTAGQPSVAVRIPSHPVALEFLRKCNLPLAAPSANISESISPTRISHIHPRLKALAGIVLDGGFCQIGVESTVLSFINEQPAILRHGGIEIEKIEQLIGQCSIPSSTDSLGSPGRIGRHYAPSTPLTIISNPDELPTSGNFAVVRFSPKSPIGNAVCVVTLSAMFEDIAREIFDTLFNLDKMGLDKIFVYSIPKTGLGMAIMDRLSRASIKHKTTTIPEK